MIYRDTGNWTTETHDKFKQHNFWLGCMIEAHDILRHSKLNNRSSRDIQMVITFHSDVQFRCIIHRDARNWTRKLSAYSDNHNFWLGCMIEAHDISTRSKLNSRSSREIQMVITFHSDVQFRCIIYRVARNYTLKRLTNLNGHNFKLGCMIEAHHISSTRKCTTEALEKFKWS